MTWMTTLMGLLVLTSFVLWWWGKQPANHKATLGELNSYLAILMRRGYDGGYLLIHEPAGHRGRRRFVQFRKYITSPGRFGIEFSFPDAPWSHEYFEDVRTFVEEIGCPIRHEQVHGADTVGFLNVDLARDVETGARIASHIMTEIFRVPVDEAVVVTLHDVSPHGDPVTR